VQSGNVRALAVTGRDRSALLPGLPTVAESGIAGYQYYTWFGLWAPAEIAKWADVIRRAGVTVQ
jgi:tripartite-type tricarboxylate transporter receptor subunit TctC